MSKCYKFPKPKVPVASSKHKITKPSSQALPATGTSAKKLPHPVNVHNNSQQGESKTIDTVKAAPSSKETSSNSDTINMVDDQPANSEEGVAPASLDVTTFTLSLDPSDCSDIDTDGSTFSKRLEDCYNLLIYCELHLI